MNEPKYAVGTVSVVVPDVITIYDKDRLIVRITAPPECRVVLGEGVTFDEATQKFWNAIAGFATAAWNKR